MQENQHRNQYVNIPKWIFAREAWATMKPGPRALYIELKRRANGQNDETIVFSYRDAAKAINVHRNSVWPMFKELERRGFIRRVSRGNQSSIWQINHLLKRYDLFWSESVHGHLSE